MVKDEDLKMLRKLWNSVPKCTDRKTYKKWDKAARGSAKPNAYTWFCTDCTPEYAAVMRRKKLCSHPFVSFRMTEEGIEGYVSPGNLERHKNTIRKL